MNTTLGFWTFLWSGKQIGENEMKTDPETLAMRLQTLSYLISDHDNWQRGMAMAMTMKGDGHGHDYDVNDGDGDDVDIYDDDDDDNGDDDGDDDDGDDDDDDDELSLWECNI